MQTPSKDIATANWIGSKTSGFLDARLNRSSFMSRATLAGTVASVPGATFA